MVGTLGCLKGRQRWAGLVVRWAGLAVSGSHPNDPGGEGPAILGLYEESSGFTTTNVSLGTTGRKETC